MNKILIFTATYNEVKNVDKLITKLKEGKKNYEQHNDWMVRKSLERDHRMFQS